MGQFRQIAVATSLIGIIDRALRVPGIDSDSKNLAERLEYFLQGIEKKFDNANPEFSLLKPADRGNESSEVALWRACPRTNPAIWIPISVAMRALSRPLGDVDVGILERAFSTLPGGAFPNVATSNQSFHRVTNEALDVIRIALQGGGILLDFLFVQTDSAGDISIYYGTHEIIDAFLVFRPKELGLATTKDGGKHILDIIKKHP